MKLVAHNKSQTFAQITLHFSSLRKQGVDAWPSLSYSILLSFSSEERSDDEGGDDDDDVQEQEHVIEDQSGIYRMNLR